MQSFSYSSSGETTTLTKNENAVLMQIEPVEI